jgi:hypothetical protein
MCSSKATCSTGASCWDRASSSRWTPSTLGELSLFQFYRHDELGGDYSNWFAPTVKAVSEALGSAGFDAKLLSRWDDRASFRADVVPGVPEYQLDTYDGLRYEADGRGGVRTVWPGRPPR